MKDATYYVYDIRRMDVYILDVIRVMYYFREEFRVL